jgi:hypothetical protein
VKSGPERSAIEILRHALHLVDLIGEFLSFNCHLLQGAQVSELVVAVDSGFNVFELILSFDPVFDLSIDVFFVFLEGLLQEKIFFFGSFEFDFKQVDGLIELILSKLKLMNTHHFALIIFGQFPE